MTPRVRRRRDPERTAFAKVADTRIRAYVQELGGVRKAAERADLSPGTISGWLRPKQASLPDALSLLRLANLKGASLDWLCGRDVPEMLGSSRGTAELESDVRLWLVAQLKETGRQAETPGAVLLPEGQEFRAWLVNQATAWVDYAKQMHENHKAGQLLYLRNQRNAQTGEGRTTTRGGEA